MGHDPSQDAGTLGAMRLEILSEPAASEVPDHAAGAPSGGGVVLKAYVAGVAEGESPEGRVLVLCHGFPASPRGATTSGHTYPQLAERLAAEADWTVVTFNFRGTGESGGNFSLSGWMKDLRAVIDKVLAYPRVAGVWLAGFSTGGSVAICAAGEDERVRGVASFAAPADFENLASDPEAYLARARELGVVRTPGFPPDVEAWAREARELCPAALVGKIPPRPILVVHGTDDHVVAPVDARALADAAYGRAELRLLSGADHRLRHDPRAVAVLLGWMERQGA
jgi:pimeloyl-ACP methyl ester carboxylesterase